MRILLTNDDGIDARGILVAEKAARAITDDVWVVAPLHEQSGVHRAASLLDPIRIRPAGERRFAVQGTPTDCVVVAFEKLLKGHPPDLIVSGINRGPDVGDEDQFFDRITIEAAASSMPSKPPPFSASPMRASCT